MKIEKGIYTLEVNDYQNQLTVELSREGESWDNFVSTFTVDLDKQEAVNLRDYLNEFLENIDD